ncbi:MAG: MMPL family transporter [Chloroflexota bacterium]
MATFLDRLGRSAFARRRLVLAVWIALLVAVGAGAVTLSQPTSNAFTIPGTEAQAALDVLSARFPQMSAAGATARVVVAAPEGTVLTDPANLAVATKLISELKAAPLVANVADPLQTGAVSPDRKLALVQVSYGVSAGQMTDEARAALLAVADEGRMAGFTVEIGGNALQELPAAGATEGIGVLIAAVVLFLTLGSLVAAGLPLLTAFLGVAIGLGSIAIASAFFQLASVTTTLALMLGLAVGIDYALFIVSRYRHELLMGREGRSAAGRAVATAGSAVVFAGATVVIALVALAVVGIPILTQMGIAAAFTVVVAVSIALTLLPALLGFAGTRLQPRQGATDPEADGSQTGLVHRWANLVTGHPVPVLIVAIGLLVIAALPVVDLRLGLPDDGSSDPATTQRKAYDLVTTGFGPGLNGPLLVVVDATKATDPNAAATGAAATIQALPDVVFVMPPTFDAAGDTAVLTVIPGSGPSTEATTDLVAAIRAASPDLAAQTGATLAVTGQTALNIDISQKMSDALLPYLLVVVGLAMLLLMVVFRSILVPIKATLGFVLSVIATFGVVVAVFQWGYGADLLGVHVTGPILSLLPILLIGVVFGLAMDYEVFLVTRMREEHVHGAEPTEAVVTGFAHGARVVAAAAIIMIGVFSGFVLSEDAFVKPIGFALATAVLLDAFVVRMTIVPAVMALAGARAWWLPRWLDRILPRIDVEGTALESGDSGSTDGTTDGHAADLPAGATPG